MQVELRIYLTIKSDRCTVIMFSIINQSASYGPNRNGLLFSYGAYMILFF